MASVEIIGECEANYSDRFEAMPLNLRQVGKSGRCQSRGIFGGDMRHYLASRVPIEFYRCRSVVLFGCIMVEILMSEIMKV